MKAAKAAIADPNLQTPKQRSEVPPRALGLFTVGGSVGDRGLSLLPVTM